MTKLLFRWATARPDSREYRQNSAEFEPVDVFVQIEIPNEETILEKQAGIAGEEHLVQVITPNAMRLALASLESVFVPTPSTMGSDKSEDGWDENTDNDGWSDAKAEDNKKTEPTKEDDNDGWGDIKDETFAETEKTETSSDEVPWNEDSEKWE